MKVLVIPDVHLKTWIFDKAENVLKNFRLIGIEQSTTELLHLPRSIRIPFGATETTT